MTDAESAAAAAPAQTETVRDDLVERLKKEPAEQTEIAARANGKRL